MPSPLNRGFSKGERIRKSIEIEGLLRSGRRFGNRYFSLRWRPQPRRRLGVVVARKAGKAVRRNRVKRMVREWFRLHPDQFPLGDVVVIAKGEAAGLEKGEMSRALAAALRGEG